MKKLVLLCFFILSTFTLLSRSSKGKEFWIGYMDNLDLSNYAPPFFQMHVSSEVATTCTITIPKAFFSATFAVNAQQVFVYTLPPGIWYSQGDEDVSGSAIHLLAQDSVEVKAFHHRQYFSESTLVLPVHELGTDYIVTTSDDTYSVAPTEFVVIALQNNTAVEIYPTVATISSRPAGFPFTATLQAGEVYQIQSINDLSGSVVKSLNPANKVAVFSGAMLATMGCSTTEMAHIYEQMVPINNFGKIYQVVPFADRHVDMVKVVGSQNQTSVSVSGGASFMVARGQAVTFTISAACEITSNKPISVAQFATAMGCNFSSPDTSGSSGMIMVQPIDQKIRKANFYTFPSLYYGAFLDFMPLHHVNMVIRSSAIGNAKLDNVIIPANTFSTMPGTAGYSYTRLSLDTLTILQHTLSCDSGFSANIYCFTHANFYGHHLGFSGPNPPPVTTDIGLQIIPAAKLFPNPTTERLHINAAGPIVFYTVRDATGRVIANERIDNLQNVDIDVSALEGGYYTLEILYQDKSVHTHKLIKERAR